MNKTNINNSDTKDRKINTETIQKFSRQYNINEDYMTTILNSTKENPIIDCKKALKLFKSVLEKVYTIENYSSLHEVDMPTSFKTSTGNILPIAYLYDKTVIAGESGFTMVNDKCEFPIDKKYLTAEECEQSLKTFKSKIPLSLKYSYRYIDELYIYGIYNKSNSETAPDLRATKIKYYLIKEKNNYTEEEKLLACTKESLINRILKVGCTIAYTEKHYITLRARKIAYVNFYKLELTKMSMPQYSKKSGLLNMSTIYDLDKIKNIYPKFFYLNDKEGKYNGLLTCTTRSITVKGKKYIMSKPRNLSTAFISMINGFKTSDIDKVIDRVKSTKLYPTSVQYKVTDKVKVPCLNIYKCAGCTIMQQNIKDLYLVEESNDNDSRINYFAMSDIVLTDYVLRYNHTNIELNFDSRICPYNKNLVSIKLIPKILENIK